PCHIVIPPRFFCFLLPARPRPCSSFFPSTPLFRSRRAGRPVPASPAELVRSAAALAGFTADALTPLVQHAMGGPVPRLGKGPGRDRKSTRLNSSHVAISYAVFCLKKKKKQSSP